MESKHRKHVDSEADNICLVNSEEEIPTDEQTCRYSKNARSIQLKHNIADRVPLFYYLAPREP